MGTNYGQFAFTAANYRASFGAAGAVTSVTRQGGTVGSASVAFATANGTAIAGMDYTATNGTLAFAEGEISRTFTVPLSLGFSATKTINLSLSNPSGGASLGSPSNSVLIVGPMVLTECSDAALRAARAGGGAVVVQCNGTIALTNTLVIANTTTLTVTGYALTLSGSNAVRLFWVNSNVNLTLLNLKLADGYAVGDKGMQAHPAGSPGVGGAIYNDGGGVVAVDCSFIHNGAVGGAGNIPEGDGSTGMGSAIYCLLGSLARHHRVVGPLEWRPAR